MYLINKIDSAPELSKTLVTFLTVEYEGRECYLPIDNIICIYRKKRVFYILGDFRFKLKLEVNSLNDFSMLLNSNLYYRIDKYNIVRKDKMKIIKDSGVLFAVVSNDFHYKKIKIPIEKEIEISISDA